MKSVRAFLIGAKRSQRSGGVRCGATRSSTISVPPRFDAAPIRARHAPEVPSNTVNVSPGASRMTPER